MKNTNLEALLSTQYAEISEKELSAITGSGPYTGKNAAWENFLWALSVSAEAIGNPFH
jgi:bacteriocin-like protein